MLSCILLGTTQRVHKIISIFVFIVPFLVVHVQSDSDDFLDQNTVPFLSIFFPFPFLLPRYSHLRSAALSLWLVSCFSLNLFFTYFSSFRFLYSFD